MATLAEGRKAVACSRPLDPKSTQVYRKSTFYPCMQGRRAGALACMRRGARAGAECGQHAQPGGAGFLGRGSACIGRRRGVWPARACLHSRGGRRGSAQAAERIARAGTERLACGRKAQASTGFGLHAHDCARVSVLCAGCRLLQGIGKRAQAPTRDRNQACSPSCDRAVFISLKCPPRSLGSVPLSRCRTSSRCRTCLPLAPLPISALLPC